MFARCETCFTQLYIFFYDKDSIFRLPSVAAASRQHLDGKRTLSHKYQLMCAILGVVQNPNIPSSLTGLCWLHSMPPCQWKTAVVRSTQSVSFSEWSFPGPIYSKLAFHLVMVDTLTKQINSQVSKSLWWIFSDFSVYLLEPGGLRLWEAALLAVPDLQGQQMK